MDSYFNSVKKTTIKGNTEGNLDKRQADPIPWSLFYSVLSWAMAANNFRMEFDGSPQKYGSPYI